MNKAVRCQRAFLDLMLFLLAAPVFLLLGFAAGLSAPQAAWLLPAIAFLLSAPVRRAPGRSRAVLSVPAALLPAAAALWLTRGAGWGVPAWILTVLSAVSFLLYMRYAGHMPGVVTSQELIYSAVGVDAAAWFAAALSGYPDASLSFGTFTLILCVYAVFALTLLSLWSASGGRRAPSGQMLRRGGLMAALLSAVLLIVTHLRQLRDLLGAIVSWIVRLIGKLIELMSSHLAGTPMSPGEGGTPPMGPGDGGEPSLLLKVLEAAAVGLGALVALCLAFLALRQLLRLAKKAASFILEKLRGFMDAVGEDRFDEVESLMDLKTVREKARALFRPKPREDAVPWDRLDPRERVRRSYRLWLRRHKEVGPEMTARQALGDTAFCRLYERARYSDLPIGTEEAEQARKNMEV